MSRNSPGDPSRSPGAMPPLVKDQPDGPLEVRREPLEGPARPASRRRSTRSVTAKTRSASPGSHARTPNAVAPGQLPGAHGAEEDPVPGGGAGLPAYIVDELALRTTPKIGRRRHQIARSLYWPIEIGARVRCSWLASPQCRYPWRPLVGGSASDRSTRTALTQSVDPSGPDGRPHHSSSRGRIDGPRPRYGTPGRHR
jgi:hypothetical protein